MIDFTTTSAVPKFSIGAYNYYNAEQSEWLFCIFHTSQSKMENGRNSQKFGSNHAIYHKKIIIDFTTTSAVLTVPTIPHLRLPSMENVKQPF